MTAKNEHYQFIQVGQGKQMWFFSHAIITKDNSVSFSFSVACIWAIKLCNKQSFIAGD